MKFKTEEKKEIGKWESKTNDYKVNYFESLKMLSGNKMVNLTEGSTQECHKNEILGG